MFVVDFAWSPFFECWRHIRAYEKDFHQHKLSEAFADGGVLRDAYSGRFHT
jgi:hypothetical protein